MIHPFTDKIMYGNSNAQGTGKSDVARRELIRQVRELMSIDSGLEQICLDVHGDGARIAAEIKKLQTDRKVVAESIRRGLAI